jgi:hypothetical protein
VEVVEGHDPAHVRGAARVVVTSAVPKDHPELAAARAAGLPVIRRAEALAEAVAGGLTIGIAGTHGKTTTTVLTTEALAAAGLAPTGVVGGRVGTWGGNLKVGGTERFVVEADEYDRSFLALTPGVAVVTNVEADHLDIYADLADIVGAFAEFAGRARFVVACADDAGANTLPYPASAEVVRYSVARSAGHQGGTEGGHPDARLVARGLHVDADGRTAFTVDYDGKALGTLALQVPGVHNARNALAAVGVGPAPRRRPGGDAPGTRGVRGRRAPLPAASAWPAACRSSTTTRTTRPRSRRRSPRRGRVPGPAPRGGVPAAPVHAHARLRRRVRPRARGGDASSSPRSTRRASGPLPGVHGRARATRWLRAGARRVARLARRARRGARRARAAGRRGAHHRRGRRDAHRAPSCSTASAPGRRRRCARERPPRAPGMEQADARATAAGVPRDGEADARVRARRPRVARNARAPWRGRRHAPPRSRRGWGRITRAPTAPSRRRVGRAARSRCA